jgi:hypothetical protein
MPNRGYARGIGFRRKRRPWQALSGATIDFDFVTTNVLGSTLGSLSVSSSPGYAQTNAGTWLSFAANTPRITDKGLLIEEQRTNSLRNNSMQGAVAGSPGTQPNNWALFGSASGLTRTIVGTGTENGVEYIEVRYQGTAAVAAFDAGFEQVNQIAAVSGQTWTASTFVKLVAGTLDNVTSFRIEIAERDGAGAGLVTGTSSILVPTSTLQRLSYTYTTVSASTAFVYSRWRANVSTTQPIDFTLRIGWPQLELGAFATSPIRTTGTAVTRTPDVVKLTSIPWFNAGAGTLYAEGSPGYATAGLSLIPCLASFDDGTGNERIQIRRNDVGPSASFVVVDGGVVQANQGAGGAVSWPLANDSRKLAIAFATNDFATVENGGSAVTDALGTLPTPTQMLFGAGAGISYLNGYLKRVAYWNTRVANATLQSLTT